MENAMNANAGNAEGTVSGEVKFKGLSVMWSGTVRADGAGRRIEDPNVYDVDLMPPRYWLKGEEMDEEFRRVRDDRAELREWIAENANGHFASQVFGEVARGWLTRETRRSIVNCLGRELMDEVRDEIR